MTVIQDIEKWSTLLPAWQQDAIVRLLSRRDLNVDDFDDLYWLLKSEAGIADPKKRTPRKVELSTTPHSAGAEDSVRVVAIKNLRHVNAIAEGQTLPINKEGLTVIYGNNGSGKSGYSRVLKKACRARDQEEGILPDANKPRDKVGKAEATFTLLVNGREKEVNWVDGQMPPPELASIAIFDTRCARAYLDEEDDFSYVPYGLDILESLAKACGRLKIMLDAELSQVAVDTTPFQGLASKPTAVGRFLKGLSDRSTHEELQRLSTLSDEQKERHANLTRIIKEGNPREKAAQCKLKAGRFEKLAARCAEKEKLIDQDAVTRMRHLLDQLNIAKDAAAAVAKAFAADEKRLPGTGGEAWQLLFEAARKFCIESHPGRTLPALSPDDLCPLCQNPLGEASQRLLAFDAYLQKAVEKEVREKRDAALLAYNAIKDGVLDIAYDDELHAELSALDTGLAQSCQEFQAALMRRRIAIMKACGKDGVWDSVGAPSVGPSVGLRAVAEKLLAEARALDAASDVAAREKLESEHAELEAAVSLGALKGIASDAITKYQTQAILRKCQSHVKTVGITNKTTEISVQVVTKDLADALNKEFEALGAAGLHVVLSPVPSKGKLYHKLVLKLPGAEKPSSVLSEGEQRVVAIASFLAEVNVGGKSGSIVFDDPVSSLDHRHRDRVAKRLAIESKNRQVIIFTHDVYFMCILQQEAEKAQVSPSLMSVQKKPEGFGVADPQLPFMGANTSARIGIMRQLQVKCAKAYRDGDEPLYQSRAGEFYFFLRLTWERAVEEVLLGSVVIRFREGVETQRLSGVSVEDDDYARVDAGMSRCSKYAHDRAAAGNVAFPLPDELEADINELDKWRQGLEARKAATAKKRK